jgi:hypothetical protein
MRQRDHLEAWANAAAGLGVSAALVARRRYLLAH